MRPGLLSQQPAGAGVTIAVLDTGVNLAHPDLKDRIVSGFNVYNNITDISDLCCHGTAVAGTAAASTNNAVGVAACPAVIYDAAGNAGSSAPVSVNVANGSTTVAKDTTPPVVTINNPVAGTVSGSVSVSISASDDAGAAGIQTTVLIDGVVKASGKGSALSYNWNSRKSGSGSHTVTATARDAAGNTSSRSVTVTVK